MAATLPLRNRTAMKHSTSQGLYTYWNTVRGGRLAPRRYEIEPGQIAAYLSETMILENPLSDGCRVRVAGTQICDWLGDTIRGHCFFEMWDDSDRMVLEDNVGTIARHGGVGCFTVEGRCETSSETSRFEMLLLPLTHLGKDIERILGSISLLHAPSWLNEQFPTRLTLTHNEIIWPDGRPHAFLHREHFREVPVVKAGQHGIRRARLVRASDRSFLVYDGGLSESGQKAHED